MQKFYALPIENERSIDVLNFVFFINNSWTFLKAIFDATCNAISNLEWSYVQKYINFRIDLLFTFLIF